MNRHIINIVNIEIQTPKVNITINEEILENSHSSLRTSLVLLIFNTALEHLASQ